MANRRFVVRTQVDKTVVGTFDDMREALMGLALYIDIDKDAGLYQPDMYEIAERADNKPDGSVYRTVLTQDGALTIYH